MKRFVILLACAAAMAGCKGNGQKITGSVAGMAASTGGAREIIAVYQNSLWGTYAQNDVEEIFAAPIEYIPQQEPLFKLYEVPQSGFTNLYKSHRNLLILTEGKIDTVIVSQNLYAAPQNVVNIEISSLDKLPGLLQAAKDSLAALYWDSDIAFLQDKFKKLSQPNQKILTEAGISMDIPNYYQLVRQEKDFLWFAKAVKKGKHQGTVNILIYLLPYKEADLGLSNNPMAIRDEFTRKYVPGQSQGSYMTIEYKHMYPISKETTLDGMFATETKGLWRTENDFMGGPFVNYTIYDDKNETIYGLDGFVFYPNQEKAHFVFETEAILKTFKVL